MFKIVIIDEIEEGMVTAEPILNKIGQMLIAKDTILHSNQLKMLKLWGIKQVFIKVGQVGQTDTNNFDKTELMKMKVEIVDKLGWEINNPFLDELIELIALSQLNT
ncbi:MAG TPA: hypothetical protein PLE30_02290 [Candidatus Kapabacteria bacterium]|nr:hypothetical protein [Candidatus Kapabacteria bacterium]